MTKRQRFFRWHRAVILGAVAALVLVMPASAGGATVTRGTFHAFAAGAGMDISGHAVMVRTADGRTIVSVHVEGLVRNTIYGAHVHMKACGDASAGVHYRFDPNGPANDDNEIWPGFTSNAAGVGNGNARNDQTAGEDAVSVVVHAPPPAPGAVAPRIACADLR